MKKRKCTSKHKNAAAVFITAALCIAFALGLAGCGTDSGSATSDGTYDTVSEAFFLMNEDGTYTVDFSAYADSSKYVKFAMAHNYAGNGQEIVAGTSITVDSLSPFCLVGQKKDGSDVSGDDDDDSSSSSSHKSSKSSSSSKKSPKTGMNDSWMLWLMAAGVFAGASVVAYNKKKG